MRKINRQKDTVETFVTDGTVAANDTGLSINTMTASVESGSAVTINSQSYSSSTQALSYQLQFVREGDAVVKIVTDYDASDEQDVERRRFSTISTPEAITRDYW